MIPYLNVGWEPETAVAQGGAGSHFQSFFKKTRSQARQPLWESGWPETLFSLRLFLIGRQLFSFETPVLKMILSKIRLKKKPNNLPGVRNN